MSKKSDYAITGGACGLIAGLFLSAFAGPLAPIGIVALTAAGIWGGLSDAKNRKSKSTSSGNSSNFMKDLNMPYLNLNKKLNLDDPFKDTLSQFRKKTGIDISSLISEPKLFPFKTEKDIFKQLYPEINFDQEISRHNVYDTIRSYESIRRQNTENNEYQVPEPKTEPRTKRKRYRVNKYGEIEEI